MTEGLFTQPAPVRPIEAVARTLAWRVSGDSRVFPLRSHRWGCVTTSSPSRGPLVTTVHVPSVGPTSRSTRQARDSFTRNAAHRSRARKSAVDGMPWTSLSHVTMETATRCSCPSSVGDAVLVPKFSRRRVYEIEHNVHALFFETERRDLGEGCGMDPPHAGARRLRTAPPLTANSRQTFPAARPS